MHACIFELSDLVKRVRMVFAGLHQVAMIHSSDIFKASDVEDHCDDCLATS